MAANGRPVGARSFWRAFWPGERATAHARRPAADAPPSAFVTDTSIEQSAGCGFYRGWSGGDVDLASTNSVDAAGCDQSNVPDDNNGCETGPCQ